MTIEWSVFFCFFGEPTKNHTKIKVKILCFGDFGMVSIDLWRFLVPKFDFTYAFLSSTKKSDHFFLTGMPLAPLK